MIVEELLATLGVKVDAEKFIEAEGLVGKLKAGLVALTVGLGLHELHEMVKSVAEVGDAAVKSSQKLGIGVEALQELGYAAKLSDISQGQLEGALFRLSKGMEKASTTGKGPLADAFKKLHINMKALKGENLDANLEVIADAFAAMPDGQQKAALAMQVFGGAGKAMIPLLNGGSAAIREQREEAQRLGIVISEDTAKRFEEFNDDQTRLSEAWRGMKVQIVSDLLPALHEMVTGLLDWVKANIAWIQVGLHFVLEVVTMAFRVLGAAIAEVVDFTKTLIEFFSQHRDLTLVLAGLIVAYLMPAMIGLAATAWAAAGAFLVMYAPIIAVVAIITSLILLVNHWGEIWPIVVAKASAAWDALKSKVKDWMQSVLDAIQSVVRAFGDLGPKIADALGSAFDSLVELAVNAAKRVWNAFVTEIPVVGRYLVRDLAPVGAPVDQSTVEAQRVLSDAQESVDRVSRVTGYGANASGSDRVASEGSSLSATFGSTSVTIQAAPGQDEEKIAKIAAAEVARAQREMLSDAHDSLRGGRR